MYYGMICYIDLMYLFELLQSFGFKYAWKYQTVGTSNNKLFLMLIIRKISVKFIQNWKIKIHKSSRTYLY